jgi:hypothetical protein
MAQRSIAEPIRFPELRLISVTNTDASSRREEVTIQLIAGRGHANPWRSGSVHSNHNQRNRKARPKSVRFGKPKPPWSFEVIFEVIFF